MDKKQTPSIGRVVHYVMDNGQHRPAIIVKVWNDEMVNLQVFTDGSNDDQAQNVLWRTSAHLGDGVGTWHWPEYVPAKDA